MGKIYTGLYFVIVNRDYWYLLISVKYGEKMFDDTTSRQV